MKLTAKNTGGWRYAAGVAALVVAILSVSLFAVASGTGWGVPSIIGKNITINGTTTIDGQADAIQLSVQGNATQTANILLIEDSSANGLLAVNARGEITIGNTGVAKTASSIIYGVTATANIATLSVLSNNTADVSGTTGLSIGPTGTQTALTGSNSSAGLRVQAGGNAGDAAGALRFTLALAGPTVASGGTSPAIFIGGTAAGDPTDFDGGIVFLGPFGADGDIVFEDHAAVLTVTNDAGAAPAWTFTHEDGLAGGAGATLTLNLSSGQGTGANGGMTRKCGNAGTGGPCALLDEADTGEDSDSASWASTGVLTRVLGNATAKMSWESDAADLSVLGALSGITTLAMGGALSGVTTASISGAITAASLRGVMCAARVTPVEGAAFGGGFAVADWAFVGVTATWAVAGIAAATNSVIFQVTCGAASATCTIACDTAADTPTRCTLAVNSPAAQVCTIMITTGTDCGTNPTGLSVCADYNYSP